MLLLPVIRHPVMIGVNGGLTSFKFGPAAYFGLGVDHPARAIAYLLKQTLIDRIPFRFGCTADGENIFECLLRRRLLDRGEGKRRIDDAYDRFPVGLGLAEE